VLRLEMQNPTISALLAGKRFAIPSINTLTMATATAILREMTDGTFANRHVSLFQLGPVTCKYSYGCNKR